MIMEEQSLVSYEAKFKALADQKRLLIINELCNYDEVCVCDLVEKMDIPQSKLSYHLKILHDAGFILKETRGTWSYYRLNEIEINKILSPELCCIFTKPNEKETQSKCSGSVT